MRRGTRDAQALRRRLAILALLHERPRTYEQLREDLTERDLLDRVTQDDPAVARRTRFQFYGDLRALRLAGCDVRADRSRREYKWHNSPFGLSLDERQLFALGVLRDTFLNSSVLHAAEMDDLLERLLSLLPAGDRAALERKRRPFGVELPATTDYRDADPATLAAIERAIERSQQLELTYRSPRHGQALVHTVEPRAIVHKDGHAYLPVYNVRTNKHYRLRLDYILPGTVRVLPNRALPLRLGPPGYLLRYRLSPVIARNRVSENFPDQEVERHEDGSATVTAPITDLFAARRILLSYGENCLVLEPPELVDDLRSAAEAMYQVYCRGE